LITLRVPRETFAAIFESVGATAYAQAIGELTPVTRESALAYFEQMIANIRGPSRLRSVDGSGRERARARRRDGPSARARAITSAVGTPTQGAQLAWQQSHP
jgi:hypothetical protein